MFEIKHIIKPFALIALLQAAPAFSEDDAGYWRYTVKPGDSLITIGENHLINPEDWKTLQTVNEIKNPTRIRVGTILKLPLDLVKQYAATAQVVSVSGEVSRLVADGLSAVKVNDELSPGSTLLTGDKSKVVIQFADGSLTSVESNTKIMLDTLSLYSGGVMVDTKLRLQQGQVETRANPKHIKGNRMQIVTPTAIAAVRGTKFRVTADQKSIQQETLEGQVDLGAAGAIVPVKKGFGSFANGGQPPSPPVVLLAAADTQGLPSTFDTLPVTFELPALDGAVAWQGQVVNTPEKIQVIEESSTQTQTLAFNDLPDGQYYLSVRAKDQNGLSGYDALHAFNVNARPFAPALSSPAQNEITRDDTPTLQWNTIADASGYLVEVAKDTEFTQTVQSERTTDNTLNIENSLDAGDYFWRVSTVANDANGVEEVGRFSQIAKFEVKGLPPQPDISNLTHSIKNNRVKFSLGAPLNGMEYFIQLDNPLNGKDNVWAAQTVETEHSYSLREYGEQRLLIQYVDNDGVKGPAAIYTFKAMP